jgi:excisionase family DNA binding protein
MSTQDTVRNEPLEGELLGATDLLTAEEVAGILRMTKAWVYMQTRAGKIPHVSLGRYVRYRRSAVIAWLGEIEHEPVAGGYRRA